MDIQETIDAKKRQLDKLVEEIETLEKAQALLESTGPRKRGRPKGSKKKVGRPRGRPKGSKKKRGRPRKEASVMAPSPPTKTGRKRRRRRRGRPRKVEVAPAGAE